MMDTPAALPNKLPDLSDDMRRFLGGVRDDEIPNLKLVAELRSEEREALTFVVTKFSKDDLETIIESMENLRAIKRFGRFGMWIAGAIVAGASVAAAFKVFFVGGSK